jgi:hypothetical protein
LRRAVLAAVLLACGCAPKSRLKLGAAPEGEVVEAVGEVMNDPSNLADTKQRSLVDAQKKAVEMVVGLHLSAKTMVEKSLLIQSNVLARSEGYIRKYDVLKEWLEAPLYKTRIRAYVSTRQIADDLKALGLLKEPQVGYPRVSVALAGDTGAAASAMSQSLLDAGYRVSAEPREAEVQIAGEAKPELFEARAFGGLVSYRATVSARATKAQTNELLLTVSQTAPGLEATPAAASAKALAAAGKLAGDELAQKLARQLFERSFAQVVVSGLPDLNRVQALERALTAAPGAGDVWLRSFSGGEARLDVQLKDGTASGVASSLEKDPALKLKVLGVTQNTIQAAQQP